MAINKPHRNIMKCEYTENNSNIGIITNIRLRHTRICNDLFHIKFKAVYVADIAFLYCCKQ